MPAISFPHSDELSGQRPLAALPSEIVQGASDRHHFIDHPLPSVSKFVPQDSQSLHRSQGMFDRDAMACQLAVKIAPRPMQSATFRSLPGGRYFGLTGPQSFKSTVAQQEDILRQSQTCLLGHSLVVAPSRNRRRTPQHFVS